MVRWEDLARMDPDRQARVLQLYNGGFPREIRQCLSDWIESQDWDSAAADAAKANVCFKELIEYLDQLLQNPVGRQPVLQQPDYNMYKCYLQSSFGNQPQHMAALLSKCLKEEARILASSGPELAVVQPIDDQRHLLDKYIEDLKNRTSEVKKAFQELLGENDGGKSQTNVIQTKQEVIVEILHHCDAAVKTLIDEELPKWRRRQHLACVGFPQDTSLTNLENWFTGVGGVLMDMRKLQNPLPVQRRPEDEMEASLQKYTESLITKLLSNALVVQRQPYSSKLAERPLILKTGVQFLTAVRFLANLPEFECVLKVQPVFDKDAEEVKKLKGFRSFRFTTRDASKVLVANASDGGLAAMFDMKLADKKNAKVLKLGVTEELHLLKFVCMFQHAGLKFDIETSSLPLLVVSNATQIPSAWATILWCSMLSSADLQDLAVFAKPPPVPWTRLAEVLSCQFYSVGKRGLDADQLAMLHARIVGGEANMVEWRQFKRKDAWTWLDGILDLIKKHLADLWREGLIMGFVTKERTQILLEQKPSGTFLLRFSESIIDGAISFSYKDHPGAGEAPVLHMDPYSKTELKTKNIPYEIDHFTVKDQFNCHRKTLLYLYPDVHRDVFKGFYKDSGETVKGYVSRVGKLASGASPSPPRVDVTDMETDAFQVPEYSEPPSEILQMDYRPELFNTTITAQDLDFYVPL